MAQRNLSSSFAAIKIIVNRTFYTSSASSSTKRMLDLVENLKRQFGAKRDDEFRALLVSLVADDVQTGQCLDIGERRLLQE